MRIVVTGATGNVGSTLQALAGNPRVREVVGLARRKPRFRIPGCEMLRADVTRDDLQRCFAGADAVIHLGPKAWRQRPCDLEP